MTATVRDRRAGWERVNQLRTAIFSIPIRQLPEANRLRVADLLTDLSEYVTDLERELSLRSHEPPRNSGEGTAVDGPMPLEGKGDALERP